MVSAKFVNICELSIGDRPVTQTALVDIKKASIRSMGSLVLFGSMRRNVPMKITTIKLEVRIREGFMR